MKIRSRNLYRPEPHRLRKLYRLYENYDPKEPVSIEQYHKAIYIEAQYNAVMWRYHGYEGLRFECMFWFISWRAISLGLHVHLKDPLNLEIHIPFGFIRIGFTSETHREAIYERALRREIIRRFEEALELEISLSGVHLPKNSK